VRALALLPRGVDQVGEISGIPHRPDEAARLGLRAAALRPAAPAERLAERRDRVRVADQPELARVLEHRRERVDVTASGLH
jgi:hypothetical protein